jgi:aerobic carbon-monoxide dehydrogenase medium subunit
VKPAPFTYHAPASAEEALALLAEHGDDAKVLAGGQSLLPLLNFRLARPGHLIDINRLPGLDAVERTPAGWRIPALVRQRTAERSAELAAAAPLLTDALRQVAHPQIRNRGTVCGSLAHADSAAELPSVMVALDAQMTIATASGPRQVSADEFFQFHLTTAVEPEELLLAVEFGDPGPGTYTAFEEFAPRRGDFCLAGVAVTAAFAADGAVTRCRIVAAAVAPKPLRLTSAEELVLGTTLDARTCAAAQEAAARQVNPGDDVHASAAFRRKLTGVLLRRALVKVRARKEDGDGT